LFLSILEPSNRAVTTLRYTPDKPYKLQINAVNSEVEIFGATDDLFYIRYGRNFGFLPKNHLREKARGNFLHSFEIDIATLHINQEVRETNYLHEFIKSSSQTHPEPNKNINDSGNETKENVKQQTGENSVDNASPEKQEERPTDYIPIGTEPKIEPASIKLEEKPAAETTDDENDSGVEEEEEYEDDEDDEREDEEIFDKPEQNNSTEQPELLAIPPNKNVPEEIPTPQPASVDNATVTQEELVKDVPEQAPLDTTSNSKQPEEVELPVSKETVEQKTETIEKLEKNETIAEQEKVPDTKPDDIQQFKEEIVNEILKPQEEEKKELPAPAPVTEEIIEDFGHYGHNHNHNHDEKIETITEANPQVVEEKVETVTEIPKQETTPEIQEQQAETTTEAHIPTATIEEEAPKIDATQVLETEQFTRLPENIDIPELTTAAPIIEETTTPLPQILTEAPEVKQEEERVQAKEKPEHNYNQDMLLKRFNDKLGNRGPAEGVGVVEQVNKDHHHHADHSHHGHADHSHDHHHYHEHTENVPQQQQQPNVIEVPEDDDEEEDVEQKPGFLSGLMKKIFGGTNEAGQQKPNDETESTPESAPSEFNIVHALLNSLLSSLFLI
jgi:hypothetical protein